MYKVLQYVYNIKQYIFTIYNYNIAHDIVELIVSYLLQYQTIFVYNIKQIKLQYCDHIVTLQNVTIYNNTSTILQQYKLIIVWYCKYCYVFINIVWCCNQYCNASNCRCQLEWCPAKCQVVISTSYVCCFKLCNNLKIRGGGLSW